MPQNPDRSKGHRCSTFLIEVKNWYHKETSLFGNREIAISSWNAVLSNKCKDSSEVLVLVTAPAEVQWRPGR